LEGQGCYLLTLGAELSTSDPQVQQRVQTSLDEIRARFEFILSRDPNLTQKAIQAKSSRRAAKPRPSMPI
jgi:hypothetical protein